MNKFYKWNNNRNKQANNISNYNKTVIYIVIILLITSLVVQIVR